MSAFDGFLALGTLDPVTGVFTEATYAGYARQVISFALDVPTAGGAVGTGGDALRSTAAITFGAPTGLDWPPLNAFAVYSALVGGDLQLAASLPSVAVDYQRGVARTFRAGFFVLIVQSDALSSTLGGRVFTIGEPNIIGGVLVFSTGQGGPGGGLTAAQVDARIAAALAAQTPSVSAQQSILNAIIYG